MSKENKTCLVLENGDSFEGYSFGAKKSILGEVVFNTAMTGYPESLTDPSYSGQIVVLTYPLVGNYGVPSHEKEDNMFAFLESNKLHIKGLVISDYSFEYSHWNAEMSLDEWLSKNDIPGIYGVDTRQITKIIRENGVMLGGLQHEDDFKVTNFEDPNINNLVAEVSCTEVEEYGNGDTTIVLVDCGCKYNIIRCFLKRGVKVIRVPWDYDFTTLSYDGLMLSNGPGDPQRCEKTIANIRKAIKEDKPIFGICLGNQLLSIAAGASTFKLKYGHRSHNQPVLEVGTNTALITSQNHGFAVDTTTLSEGWEPYFINLNDGTSEGIRHKSKPFFSVQFHPEASGGPTDSEYLFDNFLKNIELCKK